MSEHQYALKPVATQETLFIFTFWGVGGRGGCLEMKTEDEGHNILISPVLCTQNAQLLCNKQKQKARTHVYM